MAALPRGSNEEPTGFQVVRCDADSGNADFVWRDSGSADELGFRQQLEDFRQWKRIDSWANEVGI